MELRRRAARTVQCLYCETELKAFRGLFDEDFCCRDHREKYCSSFRKALTRLPEMPPAPLAGDAVAPQIFIDIVGDAGSSVGSETASESLAAIAGAVSSGAPPEHSPDPRVADFYKTRVTPAESPDSVHTAPHLAWPACGTLEMLRVAAELPTALAVEERPVMLIEPVQMAGASSPAAVPAPLELTPERLSQPDQAAGAVSLETAGLASIEGGHAAETGTLASRNAEPLAAPPAALAMPAFCMTAESVMGSLPIAEPVELVLNCRQLVSSPVSAGEVHLAFPVSRPGFAASREALQLEETLEVVQQDPEVAPALVLSSAPVDRPVSSPALSPQMLPPALALHSRPAGEAPAQPAGFSSGVPAIAPAGHSVTREEGANQAAEPHTHAPMRVAFGNLVRIKNWRLRITFAKPA
jgi:hypothetical protein